KARAELALGRTAAALASAEIAVAIAEATSLDPQSSASVGAALMALAETRRALGDSTNAGVAAQRAGQALAAALGRDHSETRAALNFRCPRRASTSILPETRFLREYHGLPRDPAS